MSLFSKKNSLEHFENAVTAHEKQVYFTCYSMLQNKEDAMDCMQETMFRAYKAYEKFDYNVKISTWLHRIAVNTCIDHIRKRKNTLSLDVLQENGVDFEDAKKDTYLLLEEKERKRLIKEGLCALDEDTRTLLTLREVKGMSYEEIADILDLKAGTVKSRLSRAREKFAKILNKNAELFNRNHV